MRLYTTLFVSFLLVPACWGQQAVHGSAAGGWRATAPPVKTQPVKTALAFRKTGDRPIGRSVIGTSGYYYGNSWQPFDSYICDSEQQAQPQVIVEPSLPVPPPAPPRPVIREYRWPGSTVHSAHWLTLIAKDGGVHLASAVWIVDGMAHLISDDGRERQIPINAIDRDATRQRNSQHSLNLWIPAE